MNPSAIDATLEIFLPHDSIKVTRQVGAHCVRVAKPECVIEILIPHNCFESFVSVLDPSANTQLANDWMDHFGMESESAAEIEHELQSEIEGFLKAVLMNPTRVEARPRRAFWPAGTGISLLQYESESGWVTVVPLGQFDY